MEQVEPVPQAAREEISLTELRYVVRCLAALGEYQEILPPLVKENGVELVLALLELTDTYVLFGRNSLFFGGLTYCSSLTLCAHVVCGFVDAHIDA
jgi:hypothetical protein